MGVIGILKLNYLDEGVNTFGNIVYIFKSWVVDIYTYTRNKLKCVTYLCSDKRYNHIFKNPHPAYIL